MTDVAIVQAPLIQLLEDVGAGAIHVPEFQRPFALRDGWVVPLLASVTLGYPIGALTFLAAGAADIRFASQVVHGAPASSGPPEWLVVDGQQRLTALYDVFGSAAGALVIDDSGALGPRSYHLDLEAALNTATDRDRAILSAASVDGSPGFDAPLQWQRGLFPLHLAFAPSAERERWLDGFVAHHSSDSRRELAARFDADVLTPLAGYRIPIITLTRETTRWTVRVHGGPEGPALSDHFGLAAASDAQP